MAMMTWVDCIVVGFSYRIKPSLMIGLIALALSALMQATFGVHQSLFYILLAFVLMGLGWGAIFGASATAAVASLPKSQAGMASGALWTLQNVGGTLGLTIATLIYESVQHKGFVFAYALDMWLIFAVALIVLAVVALCLRPTCSN